MSSWIVEEKRTWLEWVALRVLKVGPIPSHLALIMDGNRRYAKLHQQKTLEGHNEGFKTLANVLSWCRDLGISEVTAYAFSIENFKRSKDEVDGLMALAVDKFEQLLKEKDKLAAHGVCIRVIGNLDMLPSKIRKLAAEAMLATRDNKKCFLNLAMAYTSREEITTAVREVATAVAQHRLAASDATPGLVEQCLYTAASRHPALLVRTSGETRLSDFLLCQTHFSCLFFTKVLWPELSIWHVLGAVFHYQRHHHTLAAARKLASTIRDEADHRADLGHRASPVLQHLQGAAHEQGISQDCLSGVAEARQRRCEQFVKDLERRRLLNLYKLAGQTPPPELLPSELSPANAQDLLVQSSPGLRHQDTSYIQTSHSMDSTSGNSLGYMELACDGSNERCASQELVDDATESAVESMEGHIGNYGEGGGSFGGCGTVRKRHTRNLEI